MTATLRINKAVYDMSGVSFTDLTTSYTGFDIALEISGTLPEGVTVSYSNNVHSNVGEYDCIARFQGDDNHELIPNLSATLTITTAHTLTNITFPDQTLVYDGEYHYLQIEGTLPAGVTVEYENNGQIDAGSYDIIARFTSTNPNITNLPVMQAHMWIQKADFDRSLLSFPSKEFTYDPVKETTFYLQIEVKQGYTCPFEIEYTDNGRKYPGSNYVTADFKEHKNYNHIQAFGAILTVLPATYDMSGITFEDQTFEGNGIAHSIFINGTLPSGVSVIYDGNGQTAAGEYTVTAHFASSNPHFNPIPDMTAIMTVTEAGSPYEIGQRFKFGNWAQSRVTDNFFTAKIKTGTVIYPTSGSSNTKLYEYQGKRYLYDVSYQSGSGTYYFTDETTKVTKFQGYFYNVDPIEWRIVEAHGSIVTAISEHILAYDIYDEISRTPYNSSSSSSRHAHRYYDSYLRTWLNSMYPYMSNTTAYIKRKGFLHWAFTEDEAAEILVTDVDNSSETTNGCTNEQSLSPTTQDKVFVPCYQDFYKEGFGMQQSEPSSCMAKATDIVRAQGIYTYNVTKCSSWYTRTPVIFANNPNIFTAMYVIGTDGVIFDGGSTSINRPTGIRPMIRLDLSKTELTLY